MSNRSFEHGVHDLSTILQLVIKKTANGEVTSPQDYERLVATIAELSTLIQERRELHVAPWHTGENYLIGDPSAYVLDRGVPFLQAAVPGDNTTSESKNASSPTSEHIPAILVDFGCWSGRHTAALIGLKPNLHRIFGFDSPNASARVKQAKFLYENDALPTRAVFQATGLDETGLADNSVHAVLSWRVLHNLTERGELTRALRELSRILQTKGRLLLAVRARHPGPEHESDLSEAKRKSNPSERVVRVPYTPGDQITPEHPQPSRRFHAHGERDDYYFTPTSLRYLLSLHHIKAHEMHWLYEGETVDGSVESNLYLVAHCERGGSDD